MNAHEHEMATVDLHYLYILSVKGFAKVRILVYPCLGKRKGYARQGSLRKII